jgi:hypothetical protein
MNDAIPAIVVYVSSALFLVLILFVCLSKRAKEAAPSPYPGFPKVGFFTSKSKKALVAFGQSRGLTIISEDQDNVLRSRLAEKFGLPMAGEYRDIVKLPLSFGEGYLCTRSPDTSDNSPETSSGPSHHFIIVFINIPIDQRTFVIPHFPLGGKFAKGIIKYVLKRAFGAKDVELLEIEERFPDFAKVYSVFTEDVKSAEEVIMSADVMSMLLTHPRKEPVNICFTPEGFGIDIEPQMKKIDEIEQFVAWTENMARALKDVDEY